MFRRGHVTSPFLNYRRREAAPVGWVARLRRAPTSAASLHCPLRGERNKVSSENARHGRIDRSSGSCCTCTGRPREADAGRPRILPPPRDARPAPHTRRRAGRRGTRTARRGGGIAVQLRHAPLQGDETMLQKRFAMVRGRFAML